MDESSPFAPSEWLKVLNPAALERLRVIRYALFDFDGTLSVLREGWEEVMIPLMIEMICGDHPPRPEIEREVREYVDRSTGTLTIEQMRWLAEAVRRYGLVRSPKTATEYKRLYLERLMVRVRDRLARLARGEVSASDLMIAGAAAFVEGLYRRGVTLYLASGTDHADVLHEAQVLGLLPYFSGGIYGALDQSEVHDKKHIIQRILNTHQLEGRELLVVGDGPVEISEAVARGAVALGVASDEVARAGWNPRKVRRLTQAGADLLIPDFTRHQTLLALIGAQL
jgi:phosphoglycolate phosphatase-like HAD superfamily hydrolase